MGCGRARLGHSVARVKISSRNTSYGPKYGLSKKLILWVNISRENAVEPKFTGLFPSNAGGNAVDNLFFLLWISLSVPEVCVQIGKVSEIASNLACFWPQKFFGEQTPNFWTGIFINIFEHAFERMTKFPGDQPRDL